MRPSWSLTGPTWQERLRRWGPTQAGLAIQSTRDLSELPIRPWAGLVVMAAYAFGAMLAGGLVFARRDA